MSVLINGGNYFHERAFEKACEALDKGDTVQMYIDCIGHTRNNIEQEAYKSALTEKYGARLSATKSNDTYSYNYTYFLDNSKE